MSMYRKLTTAAAVAALAFGLAACGGGGDDSTEAPVTTPMPMPPPTASVMVPDAMYLDADNMPAAGHTLIAAGESATNNGVIFSCPAGGEDCDVDVAADGSVTSTGGVATAALSAAAMTQVAQAKQDAQEEADRVALENRDRVIGKDRALETAANLPAAAAGGIPGEGDITITRAAGAMARVRVTGYTPHEDAPLPNPGWAGSRLMQSVTGTGTNHLFVYTDIEEPTRIQFYNFDNDAMTPSLYDTGDSPPVTTSDTTDYVGAMPSLPLAGRFSASVADLTRFPAARSPEEGSFTQRYPNNDDTDGDTANGFEQVSIPGNYNGAGGRYVCTGGTAAAPCAVTVAPNGSYTVVGTWNFVPELNATAWRGDQEFMSFGWWLQEPTAQTGSYTFRYYADGNAYGRPAAVTNLAVGSATYNGRAAGKFVVQEIDNTGVVDGEAGMFTAAASLTARFSGTGAGGNISGTISGFQSDNAGVDVSGWSVTLNRQALTDTADTSLTSAGTQSDPTAPRFDGATATMGDQTAHGTWSSQFFGQPRTNDAYPLGVGGVFQADNEAASIAGAFGARR